MKKKLIWSSLAMALAGNAFSATLLYLPLNAGINIGNGEAIHAQLNATLTFMPDEDGFGGFARSRQLGANWWYAPRIDLNMAGIPALNITDPTTVIDWDMRVWQDPTNTNRWKDANVFIRVYSRDAINVIKGYRDYSLNVGPDFSNALKYQNAWFHNNMYLNDLLKGYYVDTNLSGDGFDPTDIDMIRFYGTDWSNPADPPYEDYNDFRNLRISTNTWQTIYDTNGFDGFSAGSLNGQGPWTTSTAGAGSVSLEDASGNKSIRFDVGETQGDQAYATWNNVSDLIKAGYRTIRVSYDIYRNPHPETGNLQNFWWYWYDSGFPTYGLSWDNGQDIRPFGFSDGLGGKAIKDSTYDGFDKFSHYYQEWDLYTLSSTATFQGRAANPLRTAPIRGITGLTKWEFEAAHDSASDTGSDVVRIDNFKVEGIKSGNNVVAQVNLGDYQGTIDGTPADVEVRNGSGTVLEHKLAYMDNNGKFAFNMQQPNGPITIAVKTAHHLRKAVTVTLPVTTDVVFNLVNGDVDGDNAVTIFDYVILSDAFDSSTGDPAFVANADLDGDGTVTIFDYLILSTNFDMFGD
ncbi:MAG: dockerin type I repeat-containing protein [Armatimonadetes bacterium]|nr:dockerin type I repeat-containing protein [Armatimonadota bacterium]